MHTFCSRKWMLKKRPFTLMHCYIEFAKYPKWQTGELETSLKKQKKTIDESPGRATNDPSDASSVRTDATSIHTDALEHEKRPDGVKKDKRGKADENACKLSLETVWAAKQEKDEIKEAARNARYAQQFELRKEEIALRKKEDARNEREDARRQFELDERVMLIDTSGMTDVQKQFYQAKQNEILARGLE
uniref:No apical meristem-associated C-terminal domain-containing protein n=1 Tax=Aegilops tauschii subsp. strangulata TaxID=200361 RepID=A0A453JUV3_AEGTS